jgi:hypothetical protein
MPNLFVSVKSINYLIKLSTTRFDHEYFFEVLGKYLRYPFDRLGGLQCRSGSGGEEKEIPAPAGNQTPAVRTVA